MQSPTLTPPPAIPRDVFAGRRKRFQSTMAADGVALIFSAPVRIKSNDVHYRFRQDSDFYYLTGFGEEECVLVLTADHSRLYLRERDRSRETWDGPRLGVEDAPATLGVDEARSIGAFEKDLGELLKNKSTLYYRFGGQDATTRDARVLGKANEVMQRARSGDYGPGTVVNPALILHELRLIKDGHDLEILRECARLTANGHRALYRDTRPGMFEYELEALLQYEFRKGDGGEAYPSIVASGPNACILHHIENNRQMQAGDLVLVDAGADKYHMNADVTRTFPVSETYTPEQRDVYEAVLNAQERAIRGTVAGVSMGEIHDRTVRDLVQSLIDLKVLTGSVDQQIEEKAYQHFYMHKTGHYLGMDVHDVGSYYDHRAKEPRKLEDGMVCTVEPGLYFAPDNEHTPERFAGIGVRIEDDVMVQGDTPLVLTADIPKSVADVEAARRK
ncbi:MAG: aminopeptidase P N-terminal domain-containing protein [bacterium]|nr:aminopeptidase P N-terminal domain-containing protein [bacterium]